MIHVNLGGQMLNLLDKVALRLVKLFFAKVVKF